MSILRLFTAIFLALGITSVSSSVKADAHCDNVTIAEMNWASAQVIAHIDAVLLRGLGCEVELIPGDTMPTSTSLVEKGEPSIAPELWSQNLKQVLDPAEAEGLIKNVGKVFESGGEEGLWIPTYIAEANGIVTIEDALARPDLFPHPEDSSVAGFYGCPAGWNCQITTTQMFKAYGMEDAGFEFIDPGSGGALAGAMGEAYNKGEGWMGYYWGPTALLGLRDFTKVSVGADEGWSADKWACVTEEPNMDKTGADACARTYYANATIEVAYTSDFAARAPKKVMDYLNNRTFSDKEIGMLLDIVAQEAYSPQDAAIYMVLEKQDLWSKMVCGGTFTDCPEKQAIIAAVQ